VVFNHTTLEHIFDVRQAFASLCHLSRDVVIVVVPFAQQQHETESFGDYWRFTPTCLRQLYAENGLSVVYEAESRHADAASYLFVVGSRQPDLWRQRLPPATRILEARSWIGRSRFRERRLPPSSPRPCWSSSGGRRPDCAATNFGARIRSGRAHGRSAPARRALPLRPRSTLCDRGSRGRSSDLEHRRPKHIDTGPNPQARLA
jgi:hypothetical protein